MTRVLQNDAGEAIHPNISSVAVCLLAHALHRTRCMQAESSLSNPTSVQTSEKRSYIRVRVPLLQEQVTGPAFCPCQRHNGTLIGTFPRRRMSSRVDLSLAILLVKQHHSFLIASTDISCVLILELLDSIVTLTRLQNLVFLLENKLTRISCWQRDDLMPGGPCLGQEATTGSSARQAWRLEAAGLLVEQVQHECMIPTGDIG